MQSQRTRYVFAHARETAIVLFVSSPRLLCHRSQENRKSVLFVFPLTCSTAGARFCEDGEPCSLKTEQDARFASHMILYGRPSHGHQLNICQGVFPCGPQTRHPLRWALSSPTALPHLSSTFCIISASLQRTHDNLHRIQCPVRSATSRFLVQLGELASISLIAFLPRGRPSIHRGSKLAVIEDCTNWKRYKEAVRHSAHVASNSSVKKKKKSVPHLSRGTLQTRT